MAKTIAVLNVVAWSGFWAFGYLALTTPGEQGGRMVIALLLAAMGAGIGLRCWFWIVRHSEEIGYAPRDYRRATIAEEEEESAA